MDSLLAIFAAPAAVANAVAAVGDAAAAATQPFADVLGALTAPAKEESAEKSGASNVLHERIGARLQELLSAAGIQPGDCATVCFDSFSNRIDVDHNSPLAFDVAGSIEADADLMADLQELAERETGDGSLELLVQVA